MRVTPSMWIVFEHVAKGRSPFYDCRGQSAHGGRASTVYAMQRHGLLDAERNMTDAGRKIYEVKSGTVIPVFAD